MPHLVSIVLFCGLAIGWLTPHFSFKASVVWVLLSFLMSCTAAAEWGEPAGRTNTVCFLSVCLHSTRTTYPRGPCGGVHSMHFINYVQLPQEFQKNFCEGIMNGWIKYIMYSNGILCTYDLKGLIDWTECLNQQRKKWTNEWMKMQVNFWNNPWCTVPLQLLSE